MKSCVAAAPPSSPAGSSSSCILFKKPKTPTKRSSSSSSISNKKKNAPAKPSSATSSARSSIYRGVTRHRWTGRFEAHLWDKSTWNNLQNKKGRQIYLGAYDDEEAAAHTYDLAALKYWGPSTILNFPKERYKEELEEMEKLSKEEYLASLRRRSSGFSRGVSKYRGVARHHHNGRWEARIGRVRGNKYLYLGTYSTQEEAAAAYDLAAIEYRGVNAVTNFDISTYADRLKSLSPPLSFSGEEGGDKSSNDEEEQQKSPDTKNLSVEEEEEGEEEMQWLDINHDPNINFEELSSAGAYSSSMDVLSPTSPQVVDDYVHQDQVDHNNWMSCLEMDDTLPPVADIPQEKPEGDVLDLFDDTGCFQFEDNIDFLFDELPSSPLSSSSTTTSLSSAL